MSRTTKQLVDETREQLDESNKDTIGDQRILNAMNRGQRYLGRKFARKYEDMFWTSIEITTVAGQRTYDLPDDSFGRRIEKVEIAETPNIAWEVKRISNHDRTPYVSNSQITRPYYYTLTKNKLELYTLPAGGLTLTVHYTQAPELLVLPQGRIIDILTSGFRVDQLGEDLGTTTDDFKAYINVVDYITGAVKATMHISQLDENSEKVTVKASLSGSDRTSVLGKVIDTTIPTTVSADDFICSIAGTCVPEIPDAYADYLIQYGVVAIRRSFHEDTTDDYAHLKDLEKEIDKLWVGRELQHRVRKSSRIWKVRYGGSLRRLLT